MIDAYELSDAVNLLAKYGPEWEEQIVNMKKWDEKKGLLDQLITDSSVPKIKAGDFMGIIKVIKKLINDTNPAVALSSVKVCAPLANGLRKDFEPYIKELTPVLI